jgi:hypothetical protein
LVAQQRQRDAAPVAKTIAGKAVAFNVAQAA